VATGCGGLRLHPAVGEGCRRWRGTGSSNPSPSSGESGANSTRGSAIYGVVHHPQPAAVSITQATECADPARGANAARSAARSGQADCRHRLPEFFDAAADLARDPGMASQFRKLRSLTRYVARVANRSTWQFLPAFASSLREQAVSCEVVKSVARSGDRFTDSSECGRDRLPV